MRWWLVFSLVAVVLGWYVTGCAGQRSDTPVALAGPDDEVAVGDTVTLDGSSSHDPGGRPLTFAWHLTARPSASSAVLADADTPTPSFVADRAGDYVVRLTVSNGLREADVAVKITALIGVGESLEPGGTVVGPDGVSLHALPDALDAAVSVHIQRVPEGEITEPLPDELERVGHVYRVRANVDTLAADPSGFGFQLALPLPAEASDDDLDAAFYIRAETVELWFPAYAGDRDVWEIVPVEYDPDLDRWVVSLHALMTEGYEIGLATGGYFVEPAGTPAAIDTASDIEFHVRCRKSDDPNVCGDVPTTAYAAAMAEAYATFTGLGFEEPKIRTRYRAGLGPPTVYLFGFTYTKDGTRKCNWSKAPAYYNPVTANVVVCLGPDGFTAQRELTTWHEYFHATQFGYGIMLDLVIKRHWILEGTAKAAESVLEMVRAGRNTTRWPVDRRDHESLRTVDVGLREHGGGIEYDAQDFWVFLGKWHDRGFSWLRTVFDEGLSRSSVDDALQLQFGGLTLSEAYWAWVKNQAFEKSVDLGGTVFTERPTCAFDDRTATLIEFSYAPITGTPTWQFSRPYLTSAVLAIDLEPSPEFDYGTTLSVEAARSGIETKFYEPAEAGYYGCWQREESPTRAVAVPRDESQRLYLLVANTRTSGSAVDITLSAAPAEPFELSISEPSAWDVVEEGHIDFTAEFRGPWLGDHTSVVRWYRDDGEVLGTGASVRTARVCPGERTITAEAEVLELGVSAEAAVPITVTKLPPRVVITTDPLPTSVGAGAFLALNGWAHETYCGEPPITEARLVWRDGSGAPLGTGPGLLTQVPWEAADGTVEVVLEYTDEDGLSANATVDLEVTQAPPGGYPPTVVIDSPRDGAYYWHHDGNTVTLSGRAADPEDGELTGESLVWSARRADGDWLDVGTGGTLSYTFHAGGTYHFRLVATDSDDNAGEAVVKVMYIVLG